MSNLLKVVELKAAKGTIVDSTLISAPSSTKNAEKKRDPDAHSTKKGNTWHFGYKAHIGVDKDTGLVHTLNANAHDVTMMAELLSGQEDTVYGDSGCLGAEALNISREKLIRALALTNLIFLHQKRYIRNLSAYCGAVCAGTAAACGVAYLEGGRYDMTGRTIINSLGNVGGIVCDGAKASCAAKIASAVNAGLLGYEMTKRGHVFAGGEGLVAEDFEQTIRNFGQVGKAGMASSDIEILNIMISSD